jgi:hypothetical protein
MSFWRKTLVVALALGLGWAVRGHFGHEWGASWAGGIAGFAVIVVAGRRDWYRRLPVLAALSALGWAVGGMMSYGILVGLGRAGDFVNVAYGLLMLAVVGGLYGFIGGGFLGLGLEGTPEHKPDWPRIVTEMVAGAWLSWGLLIYQLEWLMTPPRSELWAACLGAAAALGWYLLRSGYRRAFRVAAYAAAGAGLGFALGNFFQTLGHLSGIPFNWWNVMEFTLGALGGIGLAFGIFTVRWPESVPPSKVANGLALLFVFVVIPGTNIVQRFGVDRFMETAEQAGWSQPALLGQLTSGAAWLLLLLMVITGGLNWNWSQDRKAALRLGGVFTAGFILMSHLQKGVIAGFGNLSLEQYLYWIILLMLLLLSARSSGDSSSGKLVDERSEGILYWSWLVLILILLILVLAGFLISLHDGLPGIQERF